MSKPRWILRFESYSKALLRLKEAVEQTRQHPLSDLEKDGINQRYEFTHELAWKVMKDYAEYQGYTEVGGSRDASRLAFQMSLITDIDGWLEMIRYRNLTSHIYEKAFIDNVIQQIIKSFYPLMQAFYETNVDRFDKKNKELRVIINS